MARSKPAATEAASSRSSFTWAASSPSSSAVIFGAAACLAAWAPHDIFFSFVYPNLLVFVAGLPSQVWLPPLYLRLVGPHPPDTVEAAILGMPLIFDSKAAADAEASIQFRVGETTAATSGFASPAVSARARRGWPPRRI